MLADKDVKLTRNGLRRRQEPQRLPSKLSRPRQVTFTTSRSCFFTHSGNAFAHTGEAQGSAYPTMTSDGTRSNSSQDVRGAIGNVPRVHHVSRSTYVRTSTPDVKIACCRTTTKRYAMRALDPPSVQEKLHSPRHSLPFAHSGHAFVNSDHAVTHSMGKAYSTIITSDTMGPAVEHFIKYTRRNRKRLACGHHALHVYYIRQTDRRRRADRGRLRTQRERRRTDTWEIHENDPT